MITKNEVMEDCVESENYENSMQKLLLHSQKCQGILDMLCHNTRYDKTFPVCIELHLTNLCNLNCDWCIDRKIRADQASIPLPTLIRLLDCIRGSNIGITIEGGGEPTLHPNFDEFVIACHERNINVGLITNGTRKLSRNIIEYFDYIRISIDSSTPEEYVIEKGKNYFNQIIENLHYVRDNNSKCVLGLSYVLNNRNYRNLSHLFQIIEDIDVDFIRFRNVEENEELSLTEKMMLQVEEEIDAYRQNTAVDIVLSRDTQTNQTNNLNLPYVAHSIRALITASGDMMLCSKRRHDPIVLGNINQQDFSEIWNSEKRISVSQKLLNRDSQIGCAVCRITKYNELFYNINRVKSKNFI